MKQGSVIGGSLLIGGSCIGAGMLGLPVITGIAGFVPSLVMFFFAWAFMTTTGLLLVEVNQWFDSDINLGTMVDKTLGPVFKGLTQILYLFLFYALLVAYIAGSGQHLSDLFKKMIPAYIGSFFFVLLFGNFVYMGTRSVDLFNRLLMVLKIGAFLIVVFLGLSYIQAHLLVHMEWTYAFFPIPILIISFGFHNMIPTLNHYLGGDTKRVRWAIIGGSSFALCIYIIWEFVCLGIIPSEGTDGLLAAYNRGADATQVIKSFVQNAKAISYSSLGLALFAILTSFLAQSLSLVHFISDMLENRGENRESMGVLCITLIPPLVMAMIYPGIFFEALCFAGGICAVILFGVFPALMVWKGRYRQGMESPYQTYGGKGLLIAVIVISLVIFIQQLSDLIHFPLFPVP
ncbi:MAG: tyrosine transporter [Simkaniaceae bacterium]|nr:tyrosine transporter [Simkaniaceae bacterium]